MCCNSNATILVPSFILLHVFLGLQRVLVPISPAKMPKSQLCTLITFFWLVRFAPYFAKSLRYRYRSFFQSLLLFLAAKKKSFFYDPGLAYLYLCISLRVRINETRNRTVDRGRVGELCHHHHLWLVACFFWLILILIPVPITISLSLKLTRKFSISIRVDARYGQYYHL